MPRLSPFVLVGALLTSGTATAGPSLGGCPMLPANNIWNTRIDKLPVHPLSKQYIDTLGRTTGLHMDFGAGNWDGGPIGIPYNVVRATQAPVAISFQEHGESDPGPYPIPAKPKLEYPGDHHMLILDRDSCLLYETWNTRKTAAGAWRAGSGAIFNLGGNPLRPDGWTSADAAGLPILPGLARYDEVAKGAIKHALRFTAHITRGHVWPARHQTSAPDDPSLPPMGLRFRLKRGYDISGYPPQAQVLLTAMKRYGLILADNGSDWYVTGVPDPRWDNDLLHLLGGVKGDAFEAVDSSGLMIDPNSGEARQP